MNYALGETGKGSPTYLMQYDILLFMNQLPLLKVLVLFYFCAPSVPPFSILLLPIFYVCFVYFEYTHLSG